jgi:hypothetical protein
VSICVHPWLKTIQIALGVAGLYVPALLSPGQSCFACIRIVIWNNPAHITEARHAMPKKSKKAETVYEAVEQKDLKRLVELINEGADVNESEEDTALSRAGKVSVN